MWRADKNKHTVLAVEVLVGGGSCLLHLGLETAMGGCDTFVSILHSTSWPNAL